MCQKAANKCIKISRKFRDKRWGWQQKLKTFFFRFWSRSREWRLKSAVCVFDTVKLCCQFCGKFWFACWADGDWWHESSSSGEALDDQLNPYQTALAYNKIKIIPAHHRKLLSTQNPPKTTQKQHPKSQQGSCAVANLLNKNFSRIFLSSSQKVIA